MRTLCIALALLAWALSCFVTISYSRARMNARLAGVATQRAGDLLTTRQATADRANESARSKTEQDELALETDQAVLAGAKKAGRPGSTEQQVVAADKATLEADRIMQYTQEDFARTNPDAKVASAQNALDRFRKAQADWQETHDRDVQLIRALAVFWLFLLILSGWTWYRHRAPGPAASDAKALNQPEDLPIQAEDRNLPASGG